jgi:hypothetical protein
MLGCEEFALSLKRFKQPASSITKVCHKEWQTLNWLFGLLGRRDPVFG